MNDETICLFKYSLQLRQHDDIPFFLVMTILSKLRIFRKKTSAAKKSKQKSIDLAVANEELVVFQKTLKRLPFGRIVAEQDGMTLDENDYREFCHIAKKFEHDNVVVTKITYIANESLYRRYMAKKKQFQETKVSDEEVVVFHGTSKSNIESIVCDGFSVGGVEGHPIRHGALFGTGVYTSRTGVTPVIFSPDMCVVACLALPGNVEVHSRSPEKHKNWLIFASADQILPCYVVHFAKDGDYAPLLSIEQQLSYLRLAKHDESERSESEQESIEDADFKAVECFSTVLDRDEVSSPRTIKMIQKQLQWLLKVQMNTNVKERGWTLLADKLDRMDVWPFLLSGFADKLPLAKDLKKHAQDGIALEISFADEYPEKPPFVRVVSPRLMRYQEGAGGHVTAGGSICLELLTTSGWDPRCTIEAILQIVQVLLSSKKPAARLAKNYNVPYTIEEARRAFVRVATQHNWM